MDRFNCQAIILARTNFGEADRIITFLTPDHGKLKAIAKGVRKSKSKLAGALEIFSVSQIMVLPGKNEINTVMSARLEKHYGSIVKNVERTSVAYEFMSLANKATQEKPEADYFHLLNQAFAGLDEELDINLCNLWFKAWLLKLTGHMPNLKQGADGRKLTEAKSYKFDFDKMCFNQAAGGKFKPNDIKFLRLIFASVSPKAAARIQDSEKLAPKIQGFMDAMLATQLHI